MHMYEDWIESKGATQLLTSKVREGGPWLCELLVFNSFVGCISPGSFGLLIIASSHESFFFFFFHQIQTRKMGKEQDYEECSIFFHYFFFRFNRDLIVWFPWSFAGLQSVPYWRTYHGYQQKKSSCIKRQMRIVGEAGMLSLIVGLLWM